MTRRYAPFSATRRGFLKSAGAVAAGLTMLPYKALSAEEKELNFYNWDTYIGEDTLSNFNEATGVTVRMDLFADNDELFAKLKDGNPGSLNADVYGKQRSRWNLNDRPWVRFTTAILFLIYIRAMFYAFVRVVARGIREIPG